MVSINTLLVDTVNGQPLPHPVRIGIDNIDLPGAQRCVIKGYETVRMVSNPPAYEDWLKETGKEARAVQAVWHAQFYFEALSVVSPASLAIREER